MCAEHFVGRLSLKAPCGRQKSQKFIHSSSLASRSAPIVIEAVEIMQMIRKDQLRSTRKLCQMLWFRYFRTLSQLTLPGDIQPSDNLQQNYHFNPYHPTSEG